MSDLFDGTAFLRYDEFGYQADRPHDTANAHLLRNNSKWLGRYRGEAVRHFRMKSVGDQSIEPFYFAAANWMTLAAEPWYTEASESKFTSHLVYKATSTSAIELLFYIFDMDRRRFVSAFNFATPGNADQVAGTKAEATIVSDSQRFAVGWAMQSRAFSNSKSENLTGPSMAGKMGDPSTGATNSTVAFKTDDTRDWVEIIGYDNTQGYSYTADGHNVSWTPGLGNESGQQINGTWGELEKLGPISMRVREENPKFGDDEPNGQVAPNQRPQLDTGWGGQIKLGEDWRHQPRSLSFGTPDVDQPSTSSAVPSWDRTPRWRKVEGGNTTTWENIVDLHNDDGNNPELIQDMIVVGVDQKAYDNGEHLTEQRGLTELGTAASGISLDVTLTLKSLDQNTTDTNTETVDVFGYPIASTPKHPFLFGQFLQTQAGQDTDEFPNWREGQMHLMEGTDLQLMQWVSARVPKQEVGEGTKRLETTLDASSLDSKWRVLALGAATRWRWAKK